MNAATAFVSIRSEMEGLKEPARPAVVKLIWLAQSFALLDYLITGSAGPKTGMKMGQRRCKQMER